MVAGRKETRQDECDSSDGDGHDVINDRAEYNDDTSQHNRGQQTLGNLGALRHVQLHCMLPYIGPTTTVFGAGVY